MLGNLWGVVSNGVLAAYYGTGALLNNTLNLGNGFLAIVSAARGDVRGAVTGAVAVISNGANGTSQSSQAVAHAIAAANSGFWFLVDCGNGVRWVYIHTIGSSAPAPRPTGLLALPAPPLQNDANTPVNPPQEEDPGHQPALLAIMPPPIILAADHTEPHPSPIQANEPIPAPRQTFNQ